MFYYKIFGFRIESDIDFPQLVLDDSNEEPNIKISSGLIPEDILQHDNESTVSFDQDNSWLVNKTMRMHITNGNSIIYSLKSGKNEQYMRTYILGYGLSMVCMQRGLMAFHCSALQIGNKAYIICGESGSGKSTLTSKLIEKYNAQFLADDMTVVYKDDDDIIYVEPAFPYQKLCRDVALRQGYNLEELIYINEEKDKFLVPCKDQFCYNRLPLGGMIYLYTHKNESLICNECTGFNLFHLCINNLFLRHLLGKDKYSPMIGEKCLKIASVLKACTIGRPIEQDTLEEIISYINNFIKQTQ